MKKQITLLAILFVAFTSMAQNGFNYKALIANNGNVLNNHNVTIKFTILQGSSSVYQETQTTTTDANGIVVANIGEGTVVSGDFTTVDWAIDSSLKVEINTGSGYQDFGTSELKSVPYAKYADKANNVFSGNYGDLSNKPITFFKVQTTNPPDNIQDKIYHLGEISIGANHLINSSAKLSINVNFQDNTEHRGISIRSIEGGTHAHVGIFSEMGGNGSGSRMGIVNSLRGDNDGFKFGVINHFIESGNGEHYGIYNALFDTGNGKHTGTTNILAGSGNGDQYGVYDSIANTGIGKHYGNYSVLSGNGVGKQYGLYNKIENTGDEEHYGVYNEIIGNSTGIHYGVKNIVEAGTTTATQYGTYNSVTSNGPAMKYGTYNVIPNTAYGYGIAVYGRAENGTNDEKYAGFFKGRMYVSDNVGLGITSPVARLQTIPNGNIRDGANIDVTKAGLVIGTDTDAMVFDKNQIERLGSDALHLNFCSTGDVNLAHGGGDVIINNKLVTPETGTSDMKAYAYGTILSNASILNQSNNFTVHKAGTGKYEITFTNDSFDYDNFTVSANFMGMYSYPVFVNIYKKVVSGANDKLVIETKGLNLSTNHVQNYDSSFFFTVFKK